MVCEVHESQGHISRLDLVAWDIHEVISTWTELVQDLQKAWFMVGVGLKMYMFIPYWA